MYTNSGIALNTKHFVFKSVHFDKQMCHRGRCHGRSFANTLNANIGGDKLTYIYTKRQTDRLINKC